MYSLQNRRNRVSSVVTLQLQKLWATKTASRCKITLHRIYPCPRKMHRRVSVLIENIAMVIGSNERHWLWCGWQNWWHLMADTAAIAFVVCCAPANNAKFIRYHGYLSIKIIMLVECQTWPTGMPRIRLSCRFKGKFPMKCNSKLHPKWLQIVPTPFLH